jgi:hypothetical protein
VASWGGDLAGAAAPTGGGAPARGAPGAGLAGGGGGSADGAAADSCAAGGGAPGCPASWPREHPSKIGVVEMINPIIRSSQRTLLRNFRNLLIAGMVGNYKSLCGQLIPWNEPTLCRSHHSHHAGVNPLFTPLEHDDFKISVFWER